MKIPMDALVPIRNITSDSLSCTSNISKNLIFWWPNEDSVVNISFKELVQLAKNIPQLFESELLTIDDGEYTIDEVIKQLTQCQGG